MIKTAQMYDGYQKSALQVLVARKDAEIESLQLELAEATKSRNYHMRRSAELKAEVSMLVGTLEVERAKVCWRPGRHISSYGGYCLALKRAIGHASARATALIAAGDEERGGVKDARTVMQFEHRAATAKTLQVKHKQADVAEWELQTVQLKCDATNQEAVEKRKVHISFVTSYSLREMPAASTEPPRGVPSYRGAATIS